MNATILPDITDLVDQLRADLGMGGMDDHTGESARGRDYGKRPLQNHR